MTIHILPVVTSGNLRAGLPGSVTYTYTATDGTGTFSESLHVTPNADGYDVSVTNDDAPYPEGLAWFDTFEAASDYALECVRSVTPADLAEFFPRPKED